MTNKRVLGFFTLNCQQTGYWVRVDYYIVMNWTHLSVIVQCQSDGCSLSCKDDAVVWLSFGQLAAGCLTILEMVVDDHCCPHSPHPFWSHQCKHHHGILVLRLIEFSLGFLSGDHTFAHSFSEVVSRDRHRAFVVASWVSPEGRPIRHWFLQRPWLSLPWYQQQGPGVGSYLLSYSAGKAYRYVVVQSNSCRAWCAGLSTQARVFR